MIVLLVLTFATVAVGIHLMAGMVRRDEPVRGMLGLFVLQVAGILGAMYGALDAD